MAMLLLKGVQMFCNVPGHQIIGPTLASVLPISLPNWVAWVTWILVLRFSKNAKLKALVQKDGKLDYKRLFGFGVLFGSLVMWPVYFIIMLFACRSV